MSNQKIDAATYFDDGAKTTVKIARLQQAGKPIPPALLKHAREVDAEWRAITDANIKGKVQSFFKDKLRAHVEAEDRAELAAKEQHAKDYASDYLYQHTAGIAGKAGIRDRQELESIAKGEPQLVEVRKANPAKGKSELVGMALRTPDHSSQIRAAIVSAMADKDAERILRGPTTHDDMHDFSEVPRAASEDSMQGDIARAMVHAAANPTSEE